MASNEEDREIDKFISPIRCLYSDYATTVDKFKEENGVLLVNYELEDLGDDAGYKLYSKFSNENDGELARELVQAWICDHRLEVTNCVRIALDNRKQSFCNWFRDSEQYSSPDELLLYCLGKQNNLHISIFNSKYVWLTLSKHLRYDYFEIVEHSHIILVFLGERHYAIFRKKNDPVDEPLCTSNTSLRGRGRARARVGITKKDTKKKTVCRSSNKKEQSASPIDKHPQTLELSRKECFGIGNKSTKFDAEKYGRGKQRRGQIVDYHKLNEGDEGDEQMEFIPASSKRTKHPPVRSGPTSHRQSAQKQSTESSKVTTISTVKSRKQTITESTVNHPLTGIPAGPVAKESSSPDGFTAAIAVTLMLAPTITTNTDARTSMTGIKDAFLGVPITDDLLLPDLVTSKEPAESTQDIVSTEDEQKSVDALLSLSSVCDLPPSFIEPDIEDNSLLVPIGGQAICEDVAPTESRLGQVEVDSEIARMIALEERTSLEKSDNHEQTTPLTGVPAQKPNEQPGKDFITKQQNQTCNQSSQPALTGVQPDPPEAQPPVSTPTDHEAQDQTPPVSTDRNTGARPKTGSNQQMTDMAGKKGSKGAFKSQLYGLRRKRPKDRAYKCQVCGTSKRSMEALNEHHHRNHNPQMCGVCGKMFELATTLAHHMYSHNVSKHHCDKCDFHCFFKSELEAHKVVHREQPTHKCMYPKCGHWFKRKGELSLHVETHKKIWYDCKKCDFSTKLLKYLKEHEKSHIKKNEDLPYACDICGKRFLWHSGVKRHKEKMHPS